MLGFEQEYLRKRCSKHCSSWTCDPSEATSRVPAFRTPQLEDTHEGVLELNAQLGSIEFGLAGGERLFESVHRHLPVLELLQQHLFNRQLGPLSS